MIVNFITYNKSTGEVISSGYTDEKVVYKQETDSIGVIITPSLVNFDEVYVEVETQEVINIGKKPSYDYSFDVENKEWNIDSDKKASSIRLERDRLLTETDWTQLPDIPDNIKSTYATYRQSLRDITNQIGFPLDVTFPDKP